MTVENNLLRTDPTLIFDKAEFRMRVYGRDHLTDNSAGLGLDLSAVETIARFHRRDSGHKYLSAQNALDGVVNRLTMELFPPGEIPKGMTDRKGSPCFIASDLVSARFLTRLGRRDLAEDRDLRTYIVPEFDENRQILGYEFRVLERIAKDQSPVLYINIHRDGGFTRYDLDGRVLENVGPDNINRPEIQYAIQALAAEFKIQDEVTEADKIIEDTRITIEALTAKTDSPWTWKNLVDIFDQRDNQWKEIVQYLTAITDAKRVRTSRPSVAEKKAFLLRMTEYNFADLTFGSQQQLWQETCNMINIIADHRTLGFNLLVVIPDAQRILGNGFRPVMEEALKNIFSSIDGRVHEFKLSALAFSRRKGLSPQQVFGTELDVAFKTVEQFEARMGRQDWLRQQVTHGFEELLSDRNFVERYDRVADIRQLIRELRGE